MINHTDLPKNIPEEYELLDTVGSGGNTAVFLLYDRVCERKVLLKRGRADFIGREARILSKLEGNGVPIAYRCTEDGKTADLFRQYIEGKTLGERIAAGGKLPVKKSAETGIAICEIISGLHGADPPIIHRDIKSENIIITPEEKIYMIDFGISREYDSAAARDTCVMGTPSSAPPEQFGYGQTDERSDIYSIGALLREITEEDGGRDFRKISKIIKKCTMFSPEDRYKNVSEIKRDLRKITERRIPKKLFAVLGATFLCISFLSGAVMYIKSVYKNETFYFVPLDKTYLGDYILTERIPKSVLERYEGDIRISLEIAVADRNKNWANFAVIAITSDGFGPRTLKAEIDSAYLMNDDGFMEISVDWTECEFVLSRDAVEALSEEGICFQPANIMIKSALLSEAE